MPEHGATLDVLPEVERHARVVDAFGRVVTERRALVRPRDSFGRDRVGELEPFTLRAEHCQRGEARVGVRVAQGRAELRHRTTAPQRRHVDHDRPGSYLTGEYGRDAAQGLLGMFELGRHRPRRDRGDDPAVRHDRAVPRVGEVGPELTVPDGRDGSAGLEE